ncbi:heavy metal-associated isoprenylated plant protein 3-like isoform X1 [Primulina tabacum]|uniref:heavy metal-associated isoprenylated plant protein 3-like isoform X1 n=1 Tax=Primulina tabacum TaxID=48773 RepID=UPI003F5A4129
MGKQKKNTDAKEGDNKKNDDGGGKGNVTVVLKADLHCDGCATKIIKCILSFDGVDIATIGEGQKITVVGKVDPLKLREKVEQKTHKKIELISPVPKKEANNGDNKENAKGKENNGGDNQKQEKKKESKDKNSKDKPDEKKSKEKEIPVTTAVLKINLHCEGCIQKIRKIVTRTKGYQDMKIDRQKELVTVTGAMDMKALAEMLKKHLKKNVEIVPPKKEGEKKEGGGGGGDKKKGGGGGDGGEAGSGGGGEKMEGNKMQYQAGYTYPFMYGPGPAGDQFHYNPFPVGLLHAPQLFSDENPNACSVM